MGLEETLDAHSDPPGANEARPISDRGVVEEIRLTVKEGFEGRIVESLEVDPDTGMRIIPGDHVILRPARDVEKFLWAIGDTLAYEIDSRTQVARGVPGADPDVDYVEFIPNRRRVSRKGTSVTNKYQNGAHVTYTTAGAGNDTAYGTATDPTRTVFVLAIKDVPDDQKTLDFTTVDGDSLTGIPISRGDVFDDWLIDTYTVDDPNTTGGTTNVLEARE